MSVVYEVDVLVFIMHIIANRPSIMAEEYKLLEVRVISAVSSLDPEFSQWGHLCWPIAQKVDSLDI